jgi:predicted HD superfamily hydrolase involved in NAD metabolism
MTIDEMKNKLQAVLKPKRYTHSINVMETAGKLAEKYGIDMEKAALAGLLHDCARDIKGEKVFELCDEFGIKVDYIGIKQPELLHGAIGSKLAVTEYGIDDTEILDAICYHTTGCENMSLLSKIVFMADYIEPGRTFPGANDARKLAYKDIDSAMVMALDKTIKYVIDRGALIHPNTVNARNSIIFENMAKDKK